MRPIPSASGVAASPSSRSALAANAPPRRDASPGPSWAPGAAGRKQHQQRRDALDGGVERRAVREVQGRRAQAGALAGQDLVRARAAELERDFLVEVTVRHHDREHRHTRGVRHASSLGEREQ